MIIRVDSSLFLSPSLTSIVMQDSPPRRLKEQGCVDQKWFGDVSLVGEVLRSNLDSFFMRVTPPIVLTLIELYN
jgi:hypothetical protein